VKFNPTRSSLLFVSFGMVVAAIGCTGTQVIGDNPSATGGNSSEGGAVNTGGTSSVAGAMSTGGTSRAANSGTGGAVNAGGTSSVAGATSGGGASLGGNGSTGGNAATGGSTSSADERCVNSGGTVIEMGCCASQNNFPNLCLIGACTCAPQSQKTIASCSCPNKMCFDGTGCVASQF